jgi:hypothetical protein
VSEFDAATREKLLNGVNPGQNVSQIILVRDSYQRKKPPRPKQSIYPWVLPESEINARCQLSPLDVNEHLLGNHIPVDIVRVVLSTCDLATLGRLGLSRRNVLAPAMSQATHLQLFSSMPDIKFVRLALALFGFKTFGMHYPLLVSSSDAHCDMDASC